MTNRQFVTVDGNEAAARIAYAANEVIAIYPITPASPMGEVADAWSSNGSTGVDFFREYPFVDNLSGNYDRSGDGELDSTYVYRLTGINSMDPAAPVGFAGTITLDSSNGPVNIRYTAMDTVEMVIDRINFSTAEVTARLDREGRLELRAGITEGIDNPDFVIRHVEDSGQFLAGYAGLLGGSGPVAAYDWQGPDAVLALRPGGVAYSISPLSHPSGWLRVNNELVADPSKIKVEEKLICVMETIV